MLISNVLVMALFPAFASLDGVGGNVKQAFKLAYKFVAFLLTPVILFMVLASSLIINLFYGASYAGGAPSPNRLLNDDRKGKLLTHVTPTITRGDGPS